MVSVCLRQNRHTPLALRVKLKGIMKMFETELTRLLRKSQSAAEADLLYVAKDNEIAHNVINEICKSLLERIEKLEEYVTTQIAPPGNIQYRPEGNDNYLSLKENLDLIYDRLNNLEEK